MKSVVVFCGSSLGANPAYAEAAAELGREIAARGLTLVYGGASVGLMGVVADAALAEGGNVVGVLPRRLFDIEIGHKGLTEFHVCDSMHERKAKMAELSDAFVAIPGGFGTIDEFAEILTWAQLGIHQKPTGIINTLGFFDQLIGFFDHAVEERFLREQNRASVLTATTAVDMLDQFAAWQPVSVSKWIDRPQP